jgi:two-component system, NarL family, invasion response regulator UvrY
MTKKTVVIADDHVLVARAIAGLVEQMQKYEVLYVAENGKKFTEWMKGRKTGPDIVLLDINMPYMNGYETAAWIKENIPQTSILALTMLNDEPSIINMIRAGASGYLLKDVHPAELEKALDMVLARGFYYTDFVANKLIKTFTEDETPKETPVKLNERELHFLTLACTEKTYKEIAHDMGLSSRTVEGYRDQLFVKLNIKSRVGLALYAIKEGLVRV